MSYTNLWPRFCETLWSHSHWTSVDNRNCNCEWGGRRLLPSALFCSHRCENWEQSKFYRVSSRRLASATSWASSCHYCSAQNATDTDGQLTANRKSEYSLFGIMLQPDHRMQRMREYQTWPIWFPNFVSFWPYLAGCDGIRVKLLINYFIIGRNISICINLLIYYLMIISMFFLSIIVVSHASQSARCEKVSSLQCDWIWKTKNVWVSRQNIAVHLMQTQWNTKKNFHVM